MKRIHTFVAVPLLAMAGSLAACDAPAPSPLATLDAAHAPVAAEVAATPAPVAAAADARPGAAKAEAMPHLLVHKTPTCGCCGAWVEHMRGEGFHVMVEEREDLEPVRKRLGIPYGKGSCHTAEVGGYFVEGHVPAADIKRLLRERPVVKGLVLPGMPIGSPGMEAPDGRVQPYTVERVETDGSTTPYASHGG